MSEELKVEGAEVKTSEDVKDVTPVAVDPSPTEVEAMDQGWVPLEDWKASGRDEKEWRPAKDFVERGELFKSIHTTKRELKQTQAALNALQGHHQYVFEKAHQQAIRDLRAEKRLAIRNDDMDRLEEIETEIETLNDQHVREKQVLVQQTQTAAVSAPAPEFQMFVNRNPWYNQDKDMTEQANFIGFSHLNNGGDKATLLAHVEKEMRRKFPEKFGSVKRAAPNAVAASSKETKVVKQADYDLSDNEREVMRTFVRQGVMTEAQYKAELKRVKDRS